MRQIRLISISFPKGAVRYEFKKVVFFFFVKLLKSEIASVWECVSFVGRKSVRFTMGDTKNDFKIIIMKYDRYFIQISDPAVCCTLSLDVITAF